MMLRDGMLLFHGSYTPIEHVELDKCSPGKDFGRGFYLTSNPGQARSFIRSAILKAQKSMLVPADCRVGYVSSFRFRRPPAGINAYEFPTADKEWLWFIARNRRARLAARLKTEIDPTVMNAEIIIGKVANDTTNPVITTYLNGLYGPVESERAVRIAIEQLMPDHLIDQFCFLSQQAVDCLEFQEARKYVV